MEWLCACATVYKRNDLCRLGGNLIRLKGDLHVTSGVSAGVGEDRT